MSLTDEQIDAIESTCWDSPALGAKFNRRKFARAIESAATAPLLTRIEELEAQLAQLIFNPPALGTTWSST